MRQIWADAVRALGGRPRPTDLEQRYAEPHRHYHNTFHVLTVVRDAWTLADAIGFATTERAVLTLAACAHDVVYDARPGDDERASAAWARENLPDIAAEHVDRVESLVLATITHSSGDRLAHTLLDADLSILASTPAEYERYRTAVRKEYAAYDDSAWHAGRAKVLSSLLSRDRIYVTEPGHALWENAARVNLTVELQSLA